MKAVRLLRVSKKSHHTRQSSIGADLRSKGDADWVARYEAGSARMTNENARRWLGSWVGLSDDRGETSVELRDGSVFTVYYQESRSAREKCSILWSRWKVPE